MVAIPSTDKAQHEVLLRLVQGADARLKDGTVAALGNARQSILTKVSAVVVGSAASVLPNLGDTPIIGEYYNDLKTHSLNFAKERVALIANSAIAESEVGQEGMSWIERKLADFTRWLFSSGKREAYAKSADDLAHQAGQWGAQLQAATQHLMVTDAKGKEEPIITPQGLQSAIVAGAKKDINFGGAVMGFLTQNKPVDVAQNVYTTVLDYNAQQILGQMSAQERTSQTAKLEAYALALPVAEAASGVRAVAGDGDKVKFEPLDGAPAGALAYFQQGMSGGTTTPQFALATSPTLEAQKLALAQAKEQEQQRALALAEAARQKTAAGVKGGEPAAGDQTPTQVASVPEDPATARVAGKAG